MSKIGKDVLKLRQRSRLKELPIKSWRITFEDGTDMIITSRQAVSSRHAVVIAQRRAGDKKIKSVKFLEQKTL